MIERLKNLPRRKKILFGAVALFIILAIIGIATGHVPVETP